MIYCMHEFPVGNDFFRDDYCGKTAKYEVAGLTQDWHGRRVAMQVCDRHRKYYEKRGYTVSEMDKDT